MRLIIEVCIGKIDGMKRGMIQACVRLAFGMDAMRLAYLSASANLMGGSVYDERLS